MPTIPIETVGYLVLGAVIALGALFALNGLLVLRKIVAGRGWPTVPGKVMRTLTVTQVDDNLTEVAPARDRGRRYRADVYSGAIVRYAYRVGGRDYQSTRRYAGRPVLSGSAALTAKVLAKYPPDADVTVHYNPANPAEAMLEPMNLANVYVSLVGAVAFGGFGLLFLATFLTMV